MHTHLAARGTIDSWLSNAADRAEGDPVSLPGISTELRESVARSCREILDEAARAVGSHPFAISGPLDRARRDLELFLLQHRLEPALTSRGRQAISDRQPHRIVITGEGEELAYDVCVLATGSEPVRPPVPGGDDPEILTMRTVDNSTCLQKRVGEGDRTVVVGSGFIGCEAAASLALRGAAVTLASNEQSPQRKRLGHEVRQRIECWLRYLGVDLRLGLRIEGVERTDGGFAVNIDDGDTLDTGTVLFATGVRPGIRLAAEAGLEVDHGIITDSSMKTSAPGIYAVGDIAQAYNESAGRHLSVEHWGDALEHGRIAGTVIAGSEAAWSRPLTALEDEHLERVLRQHDVPIHRLLSVRVTTSPRLEGRATRGLSYDLARIAHSLHEKPISSPLSSASSMWLIIGLWRRSTIAMT